MPGPSTAEPVVNEWRKPMSPVASAVRTSVSGTPLPRSTRSSYGLFASRAGAAGCTSGMSRPVERAVDDVHLLLAGEPHEVDGIPGHSDRERRVLLRVLHRVEEGVAIQHVDVHVVAGAAEERV